MGSGCNRAKGVGMKIKKAIFYTSAAIALTIVIIITYSAYTSHKLSENMNVVQTRIDTVNFFIKSVERDISKGAFVASYRTILSFNDFINKNHAFIDDANARFKESFLNGTISNQPQDLMFNYTLMDWANKISAEANKVDIKFNFTINDIKLNQSDPWSVDVALNLSLDIRDKKNTSYWIRDRYLTTKISIIGFKDPLYVFNAQGKLNNTIVKTNITNFVVNGDSTNLMIHTNNSWYISHNDSPSFLMRFEGNLNNSVYGIESLVNLDKFQQQGLTIKDRSAVDYIYFGTKSTTNYRVNSTPEWFKIDQAHLDTYQVTNITI